MKDFLSGFFSCLALFLVLLVLLYAAQSCQGAEAGACWVRSTDPRAAGYALYVAGASTNRYACGSVTNYTVTNLAPGATYTFWATAYDAAGVEGEPSNRVPWTAPNRLVVVSEASDVSGPWYQKFSSPSYPTNQTFELVVFDLVSPQNGAVVILKVDGQEWWRETSADVRRFYRLTTNP